MELSKRISSISPSITLAISAKAKQLKAQGIDVIGFGAGEPDFDTPEHIKTAAKTAIDEGFTKYTPASGTKELKGAIIKKIQDDNNLQYQADEVLVSCGAKHSLFNAIVSLCQEGDEVILPSPYWVSYPEMIKASGAKTVIIETTQKGHFKIDPAKLEDTITPQTKLFILNSPSNPTGTVYSKEELWKIAQILVKNNIYCIADEIYEKIVYGDTAHISIGSLGEEIKKLTILVNGVSKAYSMTGWRIGYALASAPVIKAMASLQSHSTSNPASISQKAALAALNGPQGCVDTMREEFLQRRDFIVKRLNSIKGLSCFMPGGAFYVFPSIKGILGKKYKDIEINGSLQFCELLLDEVRVAAVPGIAFGNDEHIRLSYATSMDNIKEGIDRIEQFINKIK